MTFTTRMLTPETWDDFAALVEASNGVWGGCWCMGFHPEGVGAGHTREGNREAKRRHVTDGTVHQVLVYDGDRCVGWCQFGSPPELPNINNRRTYDRGAARSAGLADRLHLHQREGPRQGRRRRCGRGSARGDQAGRRRRRRDLSGADRAAAAAAGRLSAHRTGGVVCAIRLHAGTEDREVAVGHAHQDLIPAVRRRSRKAMLP